MTRSLLALATAPHYRSEKDEQRLCDSFMARASFEAICFSQPQEATGVTLGVSDRRYRRIGVAFWWEVKTDDPKSKLSREQETFLLGEISAGQLVGCGTLDDLIAYHSVMLRGDLVAIRRHQRELITRWVLKGYRTARKPGRSRRRF